jgi:subtilisin family serine protease
MRHPLRSLAVALGSFLPLAAQEPLSTPAAVETVPGSYVVQFRDRSFDLEEFRSAVHSRRSAAEVAAVVERMEQALRRDQAGFVRTIEDLGGRVSAQWWIINGACVEGLGGDGEKILAALPGVLSVEPNALHYPLNNTARNATHHEADQANQRRNAAGALVDGAGVSVAVIDTGVDAQFAGGANPNPGFYPGGSTANTSGGGLGGSRLKAAFGTSGTGVEDLHGHGSHVSGSVASGSSGFRGIAPGAWIVGVKISGAGTSGSASTAALVSAWQLVATERVAHNILVANNSFSGSPSLTSSVQMALDNTALNADVLACCAAGNNGADTSASQNAWNGLAVGSIDKNTLAVSSFSGTGPLDNFGRTYPDITAVGRSVTSIRIDSTSGASSSGTSMATPMVAGGAALVRQVDPAITALEAKAILLNSTKHTQNSRNTYGLGVMDVDAAVQLALAGDFFTAPMSPSSRTLTRVFSVPTTRAMNLTATWMHPGGGSFDNLDLRVYAGTTLVASDLNTLNSYEHVDFTAQAGVQYRVELTWVGTAVRQSLEVAIAGFADTPVTPPSLATISPGQAVNSSRATITLTGNLDRIGRIDVGTMQVARFTPVSATELTFELPFPAELGASLPVTVTNAAGTSNALALRIDGTHPAQISATPVGIRGTPVTIGITGDGQWASLLLVSPSNLPSVLPGIVNLGIADNFTALFPLGVTVMDAMGLGSASFTFPTSVPTGNYYFQAISFDPAAIVAPLEASNVAPVLLVF